MFERSRSIEVLIGRYATYGGGGRHRALAELESTPSEADLSTDEKAC